MSYRHNQIYVDNEVQFYAGLRRKQILLGSTAEISTDEVICSDLRELWTRNNPQWVIAFEKRDKLRQDHKKALDALEQEALTP